MTMEQKGEKFCRILENIVKCSGCQERLNGDIVLCEAGHCVCRECTFKNLHKCIILTCVKPYTTTRNLLAQELLQQIDGIKVCLMELDATNLKLKNNNRTNNAKKDGLLPGQYPCWILDNCKFVGYEWQMIQHCEQNHPLEFHQDSDGTLPYTQNWQMNYKISNNLSRALKIPKVGLFILHISKNSCNDLRACIVMYAPSGISFQHYYRIGIECDDKNMSYNGRVDSARVSKDKLSRHRGIGLFITSNDDLSNTLREKLLFKCSVTIEKKSETIFNGITNSMTTKDQQNFGKNQDIGENSIDIAELTEKSLFIDTTIKDKQKQLRAEFRKIKKKNEEKSLNIDTKKKDEQKQMIINKVGSHIQPMMKKTAMQSVMTSPTDVKNRFVEPKKKLNTSTETKGINTQTSHAHTSTVIQPKTLYPSLQQESIHQNNPNVFQASKMVNNHVQNSYKPTPSAPRIERQPAYNPFSEQYEADRTRFSGAGKTNKKKDDTCVVS